MANLFLREPTYISVQDYRDSTAKDVSWLVDDDIKVLIAKAEDLIDDYIHINIYPKFDSEQDLLFPIDDDGVSVIPQDIKQATVYSCDQLFVNGDLISGATSSVWGWAVIEEKTWDRTVKYSEWSSETTWDTNKFLWLPVEAVNILDRYKKLFFRSKL